QPAAAATFDVHGFPSPSTAGVAGDFTVTARDAFGNIATGYTGTIHFTSSAGRAQLPQHTSLEAGGGDFSATFKTAGSQSLTAQDQQAPGIQGTQTGILVTPAAATAFVVNGFPSPTTAGVPGDFSVTAMDPFGNTATGYTGTVTFTSSDS